MDKHRQAIRAHLIALDHIEALLQTARKQAADGLWPLGVAAPVHMAAAGNLEHLIHRINLIKRELQGRLEGEPPPPEGYDAKSN